MKNSHRLRKIILWTFTILFLLYAYFHYKELEAVLDTLAQGSWRWLFFAAAAQALYYLTYSQMTQWAFRAVEIKRKIQDLLPLVLGALFVNVLAPSGGNTGTVLFADDAAKRKESSTKAVVGYMFSTVASYTSFSLILIFALFYLKIFGLLDYYEIIGALIFILPATIPTALILIAMKKPNIMVGVMSFIYRVVSSFRKIFRIKKELENDWPKKVSDELKITGEVIVEHKKEVGKTLLYALLAHSISIISLFAIFISFDIHIRYGALIAGYAFAEVVRVISPHPEGVGAVEAVMILLYTSFGVPPIDATAIAITFRAFNFWIPLALGFFYLNKLKSFSTDAE